MYTSTLLLALAPLALAQYGGGSGSSDSSSSVSSAAASVPTAAAVKGITTVEVGNGGLTFSPNNIKAEVGSVVEFVFYPKTHSVAQAAFAKPCAPLNSTSFYSGPLVTSSGMNETVYSIKVNDTKPIWFYCAFPGHCEKGMVGVINPPDDGSKTIEMFTTAAKEVNATVKPSTVQGGTLGPASDVKGSFGVPSRGGIQWGLLGATALVAAGVGSLIV